VLEKHHCSSSLSDTGTTGTREKFQSSDFLGIITYYSSKLWNSDLKEEDKIKVDKKKVKLLTSFHDDDGDGA